MSPLPFPMFFFWVGDLPRRGSASAFLNPSKSLGNLCNWILTLFQFFLLAIVGFHIGIRRSRIHILLSGRLCFFLLSRPALPDSGGVELSYQAL